MAARKANTGKSTSEAELSAQRARRASQTKKEHRAEDVMKLALTLPKEVGLPSPGFNCCRPVLERVKEYHETRTKVKATPVKGKQREKPDWWEQWRAILIGQGAASDLAGWD